MTHQTEEKPVEIPETISAQTKSGPIKHRQWAVGHWLTTLILTLLTVAGVWWLISTPNSDRLKKFQVDYVKAPYGTSDMNNVSPMTLLSPLSPGIRVESLKVVDIYGEPLSQETILLTHSLLVCFLPSDSPSVFNNNLAAVSDYEDFFTRQGIQVLVMTGPLSSAQEKQLSALKTSFYVVSEPAPSVYQLFGITDPSNLSQPWLSAFWLDQSGTVQVVEVAQGTATLVVSDMVQAIQAHTEQAQSQTS